MSSTPPESAASPSSLSPAAWRWRSPAVSLTVALVLVLLWGVNFSLLKLVFAAIGPGAFLFVRYLILPACALILLVGLFGWRFPKVSRADLWALARLGLAGHLLHVGLVTYGIHWSTAFSSSLILAAGPLFTLLILRFMGLEALHRPQLLAVGLALVGILVFLSDKLLGGNWAATGGDLALLVAAFLFSFYTVSAKPLIERHGGAVTMAYATLLGSPPVLLVSWPAALSGQWSNLSLTLWAMLLWAVVMSSFVGWIVWGWVNAVRGVARSAPLLYLMPPVAGLVAWWLTGEQFTPIKLLGAALTLVGVAAAQVLSPRPLSAPPTE